MKPIWEIIHDAWIEHINFDIEVVEWEKAFIRRHIHNEKLHKLGIEGLKIAEESLKQSRKKYKQRYGCYPPRKRIKSIDK